MEIATMKDLEVNVNKKLTEETKKNLVKIIEQEFMNQSTIYNEKVRDNRNKVLEAYRKKVGYERLTQKIRKAKQAVEDAELDLRKTGLADCGNLQSIVYSTDEDIKVRIQDVENLINKVSMAEPNNVKNKIIAKLWLSDTHGDAYVILREVLGNGIIPTIEKSQLITHQ
jgi:hypothetical protein